MGPHASQLVRMASESTLLTTATAEAFPEQVCPSHREAGAPWKTLEEELWSTHLGLKVRKSLLRRQRWRWRLTAGAFWAEGAFSVLSAVVVPWMYVIVKVH